MIDLWEREVNLCRRDREEGGGDEEKEDERDGERVRRQVEEEGDLVEVPRLELVMQRAGEEHADEVRGEEDRRDLWSSMCEGQRSLPSKDHGRARAHPASTSASRYPDP
jgi:hypothetical protein